MIRKVINIGSRSNVVLFLSPCADYHNFIRHCRNHASSKTMHSKILGNTIDIATPIRVIELPFRCQTSMSNEEYLEEVLSQYRTRDNKSVNHKGRCIAKICATFGCTENSAGKYLKDDPVAFSDDIDETLEKYNILAGNHLPGSVIQENVWLLRYPLTYVINWLNKMKKWGGVSSEDIYAMLKFITLEESCFDQVNVIFEKEKDIVPYNNRIVYLAKMLQCPLEEITEQMVKHPNILTCNFSRLDRLLKFFLENGIKPEYIKRDISCLRTSSNLAKERMEILKNLDFKVQFKPWMLRCSSATFARTLETMTEEAECLKPATTREEYLAMRLNVDKKVIEHMHRRVPQMSKMKAKRIKRMLDLLFSEGYTARDIIQTSIALTYSIDKIISRLKELRSLEYQRPSLQALIRSAVKHQKFLARLQAAREHAKKMS